MPGQLEALQEEYEQEATKKGARYEAEGPGNVDRASSGGGYKAAQERLPSRSWSQALSSPQGHGGASGASSAVGAGWGA